MFHVDYLVFAEEKWMSEIGLPRHLDFPHVWTDVSARSGNAMRSACATCGSLGDLRECDAFRGSIIA
jgi:hypothetical protein